MPELLSSLLDQVEEILQVCGVAVGQPRPESLEPRASVVHQGRRQLVVEGGALAEHVVEIGLVQRRGGRRLMHVKDFDHVPQEGQDLLLSLQERLQDVLETLLGPIGPRAECPLELEGARLADRTSVAVGSTAALERSGPAQVALACFLDRAFQLAQEPARLGQDTARLVDLVVERGREVRLVSSPTWQGAGGGLTREGSGRGGLPPSPATRGSVGLGPLVRLVTGLRGARARSNACVVAAVRRGFVDLGIVDEQQVVRGVVVGFRFSLGWGAIEEGGWLRRGPIEQGRVLGRGAVEEGRGLLRGLLAALLDPPQARFQRREAAILVLQG